MAHDSVGYHTLFALFVLGLSALPLSLHARADSMAACSLLLQSGVSKVPWPHRLEVVTTQKLYRTQQQPHVHVPEGAVIWVRAPEGVTAADLHRRLTECAKQESENASPLSTLGARISVDREQDYYAITVTSDKRTEALEIQRRTELL
jgi:hypothetical protein